MRASAPAVSSSAQRRAAAVTARPAMARRSIAVRGSALREETSRRVLLATAGSASAAGLLQFGASAAAPPLPVAAPSSVWDFTAVQYGKEVPLSKYRGQVLVVVNVASE